MSERKQLTVRERLEYVWRKRKPDREAGTELTADGMDVRTPTRGEFFENLEKVAKPKKG